MSMYEVRNASVEDAAGIGEVITAVWPDSEVNLYRIENVIQNASHSTMVVSVEGVLAGFADGFMTTSIDGIKRWELDLLAVRPQFQRRGIAAALIEANTNEGKARGSEMARGLVAVDNVGSQKSFKRCGYAVQKVVCELLIYNSHSHQPFSEDKQNKTYIFPVQTMNYSGLWIEGEVNPHTFIHAKRIFAETNYDLVGAVISTNEADTIQTAYGLGYEKVGQFQWWQRPL